MATRGRPPKKDTKPAAKTKTAKAPAKAVKKIAKQPIFEGAVQKKQKPKKSTIQNSTLIGKMADSITNTFS